MSQLTTCLGHYRNSLKEKRNCFNYTFNRNREGTAFRILETVSRTKSSTHTQRKHAGISFIKEICLYILRIIAKIKINFLSRKPYCSCPDKSTCLSTHWASQAPLPRPTSKLLWRPFHLTAGKSFPTDAELAFLLLHIHFNIHHPLGWTELRLKEVFFPAVRQRDFCCRQQM